ncbi:MAG: hypothetical protein MR919_08960, partial [Parabacteroides sp.]|nr:hypothetical protein [Parabacteroides sp.]
MNHSKPAAKEAIRFRRFERRNYSAFRSMHKVINIGVVSASTLLFALPANAQVQKQVEQTQQSASTQ